MVPPPPIKSSFIDASVGTWVSDPYQMMGGTNTDVVTHKMILNGQFMEIDVHSTSDKGFVYDALGIIAPTAEGPMTGWFFDVFGKDGIGNYTGKYDGSKVTLTGTGNWGTEMREITINGNTMIHNITYKMKGADGNYMPDEKMTITYHKKM